jgi:hypothetical protein
MRSGSNTPARPPPWSWFVSLGCRDRGGGSPGWRRLALTRPYYLPCSGFWGQVDTYRRITAVASRTT